MISNNDIALVTLEDHEVRKVLRAPFSRFLPQMVSDYQNIVSLNDSTYLFCLDDGFATLHERDLELFSSRKPSRLFIRRVVNLSDSNRLIPFNGNQIPRIKYNKSYIKILFASPFRSEEHTSELQSLMRISYAVFCLKKK